MKLPALLALGPLCLLPLAEPQATKGSIDGQVLESGTERPVARAHVALNRLERAGEFAAAVPGTTTDTDSQGRFAFVNLDAGVYPIVVTADGYNVHLAADPGGPVATRLLANLPSGQTVAKVVAHVTPVGTASGRVIDRDGQPVAGVAVALWFWGYDANGRHVLNGGYSDTTDNRGEYRAAAPARAGYYVHVGAVSSAGGAAMRPYAGALYPGVTDFSAATTVNISARQTVTLKDVRLQPRRLFTVRGRVIDGSTGKPPATAFVWITTDSPLGAETISESPRYNPADGTFEAHVGPAEYSLGVTAPDSPGRAAGAPALAPVAAERTLTVSDRDIDGIEFVLKPRVSVQGRLRVEGQPLSMLPGLEAVRVRLLPARGGIAIAATPNAMVVTSQYMQTGADGSFHVDFMGAGEYRLQVTALPPDAYVSSARLGTADILNQPLHFTGTTADRFDIVLRPAGGRVDGTVVDRAGATAGSTLVAIVPARSDRIDLVRTATTDRDGRFTFRGLPPGDYQLAAGPEIDRFAYFDPNVLKQLESQIKRVAVTDGSRSMVEIRLR